MEYAIIDIETTGGSCVYHKIIEIAVLVHDGNRIIERYQTLINPGQNILGHVTLIHGITDAMVAQAPTFIEIAPELLRLTENRIFVAHSVNFDYSFVRKEFQEIGIDFNRKKLCTVRLSRQLLPGYKTYSLGTLCGHLQIPIHQRHRAMGDAEATACLFGLLLKADKDSLVFKTFLNHRSKEMTLPPNLDRSQFDSLPQATGVYLFNDRAGKIIYVGKAKNIRNRVNEHFTGNTHTKARQQFHNSICGVKYEVTGDEFLALLAENEHIKKHYPRYNRSNKAFTLNYGLYSYENQNGFIRLVAGKVGKRDHPVATFRSLADVINKLNFLSMQHGLCLKMNGVLESGISCNYVSDTGSKCGICNGNVLADSYNLAVTDALTELQHNDTYLIKTKGRTSEEEGFALVERGRFLGYGFVPAQVESHSLETLKTHVRSCYDTQDSQSILQSHLRKSRLIGVGEVRVFQ